MCGNAPPAVPWSSPLSWLPLRVTEALRSLQVGQPFPGKCLGVNWRLPVCLGSLRGNELCPNEPRPHLTLKAGWPRSGMLRSLGRISRISRPPPLPAHGPIRTDKTFPTSTPRPLSISIALFFPLSSVPFLGTVTAVGCGNT